MSRSGKEIGDEIMALHEEIKRDAIISFFQKIESKDDILELTSLLLKGTDKQLTAFIEKKLGEGKK